MTNEPRTPSPADGELIARGLVERLRATRPSNYVGEPGYNGPTVVLMNTDGPAAGDLIEAQSAAIARLNAEVERVGEVEYAAEFLCARVRELEGDMVDGPVADQFYGHVLTALARMDTALAPKEK